MRYRACAAVAALVLVSAGTWAGEEDGLAQDRKLIRGAWVVVAYDLDGKQLPAEIVKKMSVTIRKDRLTIAPKVVAKRSSTLKGDKRQSEVAFALEAGQSDEATYSLVAAKKRKVIELTQDIGRGEARKIKGLYALEGDMLTLCVPLPDRNLPKKIPASPKTGLVRMLLKRAEVSEGK
jgi:uncharacterized protein (TIGR03067 family)